MQKTMETQKRTLPGWAGWLIGYAIVLACAAGLVYYWRVVFFLDRQLNPLLPTLCVMAVFSLLYLAVAVLQQCVKDICLRGAVLIFACGVLFCFASAPLQAPDEPLHFLRANAISRGQFTYDYHAEVPRDVQLLLEKFQPKLAHDVQFAGRQLAPAAVEDYWQALAENRPASPAEPPVMFVLAPFLHQGLFMAGARVLGFSALGQLYAGRLANMLLYAVICYFALKNCQRYRTVMLAFCLLPISLFMGASCSYDGMMLALCYLLISCFCRAHFTPRDLGVFLAALMLITYIKPNNVVLVALLLLIPKDRWWVKWNPRLLVVAAAALALIFWQGLQFIDGNVLKTGFPAVLDRGSGAAAGPEGQLPFMLRNPLRFVATALLSIFEGDGFLFDLGRFGWMDLVVPLVGGLSVMGLCLAAVLGAPAEEDDGRGAVVGLVLMGLLYAGAVLFGMYVLDTDVQSIRITGQQPRYFLPAFFLLALAGCIGLGRVVRPAFNTAAAVLRRERTLLWICAALALLAAVLIFQSYFVGQWVPKSQGGWKMVSLFGWQVR